MFIRDTNAPQVGMLMVCEAIDIQGHGPHCRCEKKGVTIVRLTTIAGYTLQEKAFIWQFRLHIP
jgi:hypothetical protein